MYCNPPFDPPWYYFRRVGVTSLGGVAWTEWMLELVRLPPLVGVLRVGGAPEDGGGEVEARAGHLLPVQVSVFL
jgi:hypothetical protein